MNTHSVSVKQTYFSNEINIHIFIVVQTILKYNLYAGILLLSLYFKILKFRYLTA